MENEPARRKRSKRDIGLLAAILIAVVFLGVSLFPIINAGVLSKNYKTFVKKYTESMADSRKRGNIFMTEGTQKMLCRVDDAGLVYVLLVDAGMGKPRKTVPEGEGMEITFADGATLLLKEAAITETNAAREDGLFVRYEDKAGYVYQYDTDKLAYKAIRDKLIR